MPVTYQSSQTDPNAANYQGRQTYNYGVQQYSPTSSVPTAQTMGLPQIGGTAQTTNGGGGGGGGTGTQQAPSIDQFTQAINDAFDSSMGYLNQAESTIRGQQGGVESGINDLYNSSKGTVDTQFNASTRDIATSEAQGGQRQQDALSSARQLYNELVQGGRQRFGGSSSAGEAYQALSGRELQKNTQGIQTNYENFMGQITNAKTTLQEKYSNALQTLETQKNSMMQQARRDFEDKLLQITQQKAQAGINKADAKLSALQDLRNQVFQINQQVQGGYTNLNTLKTQLETQLGQAQSDFTAQSQTAGTANSNLQSAVPTQYQTGNTLSMNSNAPLNLQTGQVNPTRREDLYGMA